MKYHLPPVAEGTTRARWRFAWYPVRIGWVWVWLEQYTVRQVWDDPDDDGKFHWYFVARELHHVVDDSGRSGQSVPTLRDPQVQNVPANTVLLMALLALVAIVFAT